MLDSHRARWTSVLSLLAVFSIVVPTLAGTWTWEAVGQPGLPWDTVGQWSPTFAVPSFATPGEDLVFGASTNTGVLLVDAQQIDYAHSMIFNSDAPAYTFSRPNYPSIPELDIYTFVTVTAGGELTNNSANVQTFNAGLLLEDCTVNANGGSGGTAFEFPDRLHILGTGTFNGDGLVHVSGEWRGTFTKTGPGTLVLSGASTTGSTMTIGTAEDNGISDGVVRVEHDLALGVVGTTSSKYTCIYGNKYADGRLELANNVTIGETILLYGRGGVMGNKAAILNHSGDNTLSGTLSMQGGGRSYNFGSTSGKLTVQSNIKFDAFSSGDTYLRFTGAGDGEFAGDVRTSKADGAVLVVKEGEGTLTLSGSTNERMSSMYVRGGRLTLGSSVGLWTSWATTTSAGIAPSFYIDSASAVLDVTAAGNFTLPIDLRGKGTVAGNVTSNGAAIMPGDVSGMTYPDTGGWALDPLSPFPAAGTLTIDGSLNLWGGGIVQWDLAALSDAGGDAGVAFDQILLNGDLTLGGTSQLTLGFTDVGDPSASVPFWRTDHTWKILDVAGSTWESFATINNGTFVAGDFSVELSGSDVLLKYTANAVTLIPGDTNGDLVVDAADAAKLAENWGADVGTSGYGSGDFNDDHVVNAADASILAANWGDHRGESSAAVPEPSTLAILLGGLAMMIGRRRRGR